jgi:hypothetical protein
VRDFPRPRPAGALFYDREIKDRPPKQAPACLLLRDLPRDWLASRDPQPQWREARYSSESLDHRRVTVPPVGDRPSANERKAHARFRSSATTWFQLTHSALNRGGRAARLLSGGGRVSSMLWRSFFFYLGAARIESRNRKLAKSRKSSRIRD